MRLSIDNSLLEVLLELFFLRVEGVETVKRQTLILVYTYFLVVVGVLEGGLEVLDCIVFRHKSTDVSSWPFK